MTDARLKEYAKKVGHFFETDADLYKKFSEKIKN